MVIPDFLPRAIKATLVPWASLDTTDLMVHRAHGVLTESTVATELTDLPELPAIPVLMDLVVCRVLLESRDLAVRPEREASTRRATRVIAVTTD